MKKLWFCQHFQHRCFWWHLLFIQRAGLDITLAVYTERGKVLSNGMVFSCGLFEPNSETDSDLFDRQKHSQTNVPCNEEP